MLFFVNAVVQAIGKLWVARKVENDDLVEMCLRNFHLDCKRLLS